MGIPAVEVLEICVPSSVFLYNNVKKVENGETARGSVVFAQGSKIATAVAKYHNQTAKTASEAYNIFGKYAQQSKALDYVGRGVNWATKNVNPLICLSAVYKTAKSDDKVHTGITQAGAISGMFLGEGMMKLAQDDIFNAENVTKLAEHCKKIPGLKALSEALLNSGGSGKVAAITKGIAFVTTSILSYAAGEKIGTACADDVCTNLGIDRENQKIDQIV